MKTMIRGALAATLLSAVSVPALAADLPSIKAPPPEPVVETFQPFQVRLELSGVVPTAGKGTAYDEGAFAPFTSAFAAYAGNPFIATGLSQGYGTQIPWASTSTSWAVIPTLAVDYYINKNWSIEAICCVSPHHIQGTGSIKSTFAHTWVFPPSLLVAYHFTNFGPWQPYIGVGVNFTAYWGTRVNNETFPVFFQPSGPLTSTVASAYGVTGAYAQFYNATVTPSWGVVGQVGLDYMFNEHWGLNLDVKYITMEPTVHAKVAAWLPGPLTAVGPLNIPVRVALPIDPLVVSAGLTYRFGGGTAAPVLAKY
jgi:outer membrane protein